ncbi:hypothetical protein [Pleurochrysis sp. endemic virus 1b]|nr:hypothetical protein [Pleurochrysis sp. endemic virus 1b]
MVVTGAFCQPPCSYFHHWIQSVASTVIQLYCNWHNYLPFSPYELILTHVATIVKILHYWVSLPIG